MTKAELFLEQQRLTLLHHDAFLVEFLGADRSGLSETRIGELVDAGLITDETMQGLKIGSTDLDPYEFSAVAGALMDEADPETRKQMREWGIERWAPMVQVKVEDLRTMTREEAEARAANGGLAPAPPIEHTERPSVEAPSWMSIAEKASYERAVLRGGEFARGLGNILNDDLSQVIAEEWSGTQIVAEADAARRQQALEIIRDELGESLVTKRDARALAGALADRTQYYAHNWKRIALTEIQGAHNEGRVSYALNAYGDDAQVARVPESDACEHCRRLFAPDGSPKVFRVADLMGNETNVGKKRSQWQATIWPVHPNCRCDTIAVPPGFIVAEDGTLARADAEDQEEE